VFVNISTFRNEFRHNEVIHDAILSTDNENLDYVVTPESFSRGSSPEFAWIPAKSMRE